MGRRWYQGTGQRDEGQGALELPESPFVKHSRPDGYLADPGLIDAVNVALHLGQPLLLTGQPGTGKTQLAYSVAWELGLPQPLKFETKSTSVARDICYTYDALAHLQASQSGGGKDVLQFIRWNAFGQAVLRASEPSEVADLFPQGSPHEAPSRSVVLIDEIDKAPRDFPNDLLNEVDGMYFRVPELKNRRIEATLRPVLILTSNSEKNLPEAFLRRCAFYHIPFPEPDRLMDIVRGRLGERIVNQPDLERDALDLFHTLRDPLNGLVKQPATSELLSWLHVLTDADGPVDLTSPEQIEPALAVLIKLADDRDKAKALIKEWQSARNT